MSYKKIRDQRVYTVDENRYPSVTTVLNLYDGGKSGALMGWSVKVMAQYLESLANEKGDIILPKGEVKDIFKKAKARHKAIKDETADIGSSVHKALEIFINSGSMPVMPGLVHITNGFLDWYNANDIEFTMAERVVYSKKDKFAGTLDALGLYEKELTIFDFKTSSGMRDTFIWQLGAYAKAYEEMTKRVIQGACLLRLDRDSGIVEAHKVSKTQLKTAYRKFKNLVKLWWQEYGGRI